MSGVYILIAVIGFYRYDSGGTSIAVEFNTEKACQTAMVEMQKRPMVDKYAIIQQIGCYKKAI